MSTALRSQEELQALAAEGAKRLGWDAPAAEVIGWVAENFSVSAAAVACSMADAVLPALVSEQLSGVDVLFLETGYHFPETLETRKTVAEYFPVNIVDVLPAQTVAEQDAAFGKDLFARNPAQCCQLRKMDPLAKVLGGYEVWFTGVRRDEAPTRSNTPLISWDASHGLIKVNPLAGWSLDALVTYAENNLIPVNPLMSRGFLSIGCAPCTRPVAPGEDPRAGRWAGTDKTECGIHL
ncbi:phosphoadenosine phosphosulfate reductase [Psychromicrobium silvestre]|uniref:Adenosine 5'-phosphosulfate reductase n=1 Tax=Psychromicrobium silvestre TaxID=1645614 RepID=A0A7Y9LTU4_9MICC|nr:phosphoadenylyl-sulfate reductase [Psychromicrobium silvestre]NYE95477.1 phosphoadenosine phosphosulfate reductase [Psychromicrobium silvestre]